MSGPKRPCDAQRRDETRGSTHHRCGGGERLTKKKKEKKKEERKNERGEERKKRYIEGRRSARRGKGSSWNLHITTASISRARIKKYGRARTHAFFPLVSFFFSFFLPYSLAPPPLERRAFCDRYYFQSLRLSRARVYTGDTPSFSPYKRGCLLLGVARADERRAEAHRSFTWSSSRYTLHARWIFFSPFSLSSDQRVVPTRARSPFHHRFVQQRRGLPLKKILFSPAILSGDDRVTGLPKWPGPIVLYLVWNETDDDEGRRLWNTLCSSSLPLLPFTSLSLSLFLSLLSISLLLSIPPSVLLTLAQPCPASTCGEWKELGNRRIHGRRFFFLSFSFLFFF